MLCAVVLPVFVGRGFFEQVELLHHRDIAGVGDVKRIHGDLFFAFLLLIRPAPPIPTGRIRDDIHGVVDLARNAFTELTFDIKALENNGSLGVADIDGDELGDVAAVEFELAVDTQHVKSVTHKSVDDVFVDEHLDGIAKHRKIGDLLGLFGISNIENRQTFVGIEVEEEISAHAVEVGFFDGACAARRSAFFCVARARIGGSCVGCGLSGLGRSAIKGSAIAVVAEFFRGEFFLSGVGDLVGIGDFASTSAEPQAQKRGAEGQRPLLKDTFRFHAFISLVLRGLPFKK